MNRGILATRDELQALRERISQHPFDSFFDTLEKRCALILETQPVSEIEWQSAWAHGRWNAATRAGRTVQGRIIDLVIADAIDPNQAYRSRAVEELKSLLRWTTWVDPCHPNLSVDLCSAEAGIAVSLGLDWLWESLSDDVREEMIETLGERVLGPYNEAVDADVWWYSSVNHWNAVLNSAVGIVSLAMWDELDEAESAYRRSRDGLATWFAQLGRDGGWDEGIGYWGYAMRYVLLLGRVCDRLADDQQVLHHRGMDQTGLFPIYFTPNGRSVGFGDQSTPPLHGALYLMQEYFGRDEVTWWLDEYGFSHDISTSDWSRAGLAILLRPDGGNRPEKPALEPTKVFHQIGWAALSDDWPHPGWYAAVKAGDLAASHAQRDMNSLVLQVDGEMMLVDPGYPDEEKIDQPREEFYEVHARAHNTIIVAEENHRPDARGTVLDSGAEGDRRWVVCDGGQALGEFARFHRHVLTFNSAKEAALLVIDAVDLYPSERLDLFWHAGGRLEVDSAAGRGIIQGQAVTLHWAVADTAGLALTAGSRPLRSKRTDHFLQLTGNVSGKVYIASLFRRKPIKSSLAIDVEEGKLIVHLGKEKWSFESVGEHLRYCES